MKAVSITRLFYGFALFWLLIQFTASIYSPPSVMSDPGLGFLDMINFSEGGKFQHHRSPSLDNLNVCEEIKTTWWSPGQWFFIYPLTAIGLPLGVAISCIVLLASAFGLPGWLKLYRKFGFSEYIVIYAGLLILFSRYFSVSFQIYAGANILEFGVAPWLLLFWLRVEGKPLWFQATCLLLLLVFSYFVKSSMLIFWLGIISSTVPLLRSKQSSWKNFTVLIVVFLIGKLLCDLLFTRGGYTPFSFKGQWINFSGASNLVFLQHITFLLSGPFLSTIGIDDYIHYIFQKPGSVIFIDGHPILLLVYGILLAVLVLMLRYFIQKRESLDAKYGNLLMAVTAVFIGFFIYTFLSGKIISAYEDSRHFRLAGLIMLPLCVGYLQGVMKRLLLIIPFCMFGYATLSSLNKVNQDKVVSEDYKVTFSEMKSKKDYTEFKKVADSSSLVYVIYSDFVYNLDRCKTIYSQDDFISLEMIRSRKKVIVKNKSIVFLLPLRFATNGKRDAILANFISGNPSMLPDTQIERLNDWELITQRFK